MDTDTVLRQSPLKNTFNRTEVERELNVQVEVSQQFNRNVQSAQREINQAKDKLTEQFKAGTISQAAYEAELSKWETVGLGLSMVARGLAAPTSSARDSSGEYKPSGGIPYWTNRKSAWGRG